MNSTPLADLIVHRSPETVLQDETVHTACLKMSAASVGALPVVDADGYLIGMISERDVIKRSVIVHRSSEKTIVGQIMTRNPKWLSPEDEVSEALALMNAGRFRHLPICSDGKVVGVVSIRDMIIHNGPVDMVPSARGKGIYRKGQRHGHIRLPWWHLKRIKPWKSV